MIPCELTDKNHLKWHVDGVLYGSRTNPFQDFRVELGRASRSVGSFKKELYSAMTKLIVTHGADLNLFYSGGSDSEVIARVLMDLGVKPVIHTIEFDDGANAHETKHAEEFCKSFNLKQVKHEHSLQRFIHLGQLTKLAEEVECSQVAYLTVLHYVKKCQDLPVIMGGEVYLQKHQKNDGCVTSDSEWYYIYREDEDACTYRYTKKTKHPLINEVFTYTPELLYSYLTHPLVAAVARNEVPGKITLLSIKKDVYEQALGIRLLAQTKYHGYEALPWTNRSLMDGLKNVYACGSWQKTARLEYQQLLKDLSCE